jgi:hypothetical protein
MRRISGSNITLSIREIVGSPDCVASDNGQGLYDRVAVALKQGIEVTVSFRDVSSLTRAFLNAAIGRLYGTFSESEIRSKLKVKDMQPDDLALLKRVVETAKQYFKNPKRFNRICRTVRE